MNRKNQKKYPTNPSPIMNILRMNWIIIAVLSSPHRWDQIRGQLGFQWEKSSMFMVAFPLKWLTENQTQVLHVGDRCAVPKKPIDSR